MSDLSYAAGAFFAPSSTPAADRALANRQSAVKRCIDYALAVPLFIILLPFMALVALAVKLTSKGPVFFVQQREGLGGRTIAVVKFRTMYTDAASRLEAYLAAHPEAREEWRRFFKISRDPRVVPVIGTFLRKSSLDELPQLYNVLKGDMSLVGPRPFPHSDLETFDPHCRALRASVRPGLTGLWQVRRGGNRAKQKLDMFYVKHWSVLLDLRILASTLPVVLFARKPNF